jgi:uncharacterized protein YaiE (UPF0345 family)
VYIQTAGTLSLGYYSTFWTATTEAFVPSTNNTAYFEIALGNVTDWSAYNTGATFVSTAAITFNIPTLNTQNPYINISNLYD